MRNWLVFIVLAFLILVSFLCWGDWFATFFVEGRAVQLLEGYGRMAWLIGIVFLIGDVFLPLPATLIMSALGYLYGPFWGSVISIAGNFLSGVAAYAICYSIGEKGARYILGSKDLEEGKAVFEQSGGWIVALSRWLPIIPEVVSCMAGLNRMSFSRFSFALVCGCIPLGIVFAYIGYSGQVYPGIAVTLSAILPAILWLVVQRFIFRGTEFRRFRKTDRD